MQTFFYIIDQRSPISCSCVVKPAAFLIIDHGNTLNKILSSTANIMMHLLCASDINTGIIGEFM